MRALLLRHILFLLWILASPWSVLAEESYEEGPLPPEARLGTLPIKLNVENIELRGLQIGVSAASLGITESGISVDENDVEITLSLSGDVLFDFDKATIRADAHNALEQIALALKGFSRRQIKLVGHTDSKGDDGYNLRLSQKRAEAVMEWLQKRMGRSHHLFSASGRGESDPVSDNANPDGSDNPAGRQKNRRVEIHVPK